MKCIACGSVIPGVESNGFIRCETCRLERRVKLPQQKTLTKLYTREYFKQAGEFLFGYPDYDALAKSHQDYFRQIIQKFLLKSVPPPAKLLDIGCGPGLFLYQAKNAGYQVRGIDMIKKLAQEIKRKYQVQVDAGQFERAHLPHNHFQVVTSFQTFEHSSKPLRFLHKAHQIMSPKGVLLLTTPNTDSIWKKLLGTRWFSYQHTEHIFFWNQKALEYVLQKTGFKMVKFFPDNWRHYSTAEMILLLSAYTNMGKLKNINRLLPDFIKSVRLPFPIGSLGVIAQKI